MGIQSHAASPTQPPPEVRWKALTTLSTESGAILIREVDGGIVGWATGPLGHTTDAVCDGRIDPAAVQRNATKIALAPLMLEACRLLVQAAPLTRARLERLGTQPHQELVQAADLALQAVSAMAALS